MNVHLNVARCLTASIFERKSLHYPKYTLIRNIMDLAFLELFSIPEDDN